MWGYDGGNAERMLIPFRMKSRLMCSVKIGESVYMCSFIEGGVYVKRCRCRFDAATIAFSIVSSF